jgi:hypothetical protein
MKLALGLHIPLVNPGLLVQQKGFHLPVLFRFRASNARLATETINYIDIYYDLCAGHGRRAV